MAQTNPFRFSTKYQDDESEMLYYGYRFYDPSIGRWLSRDPIGELGGVSLYEAFQNDPITRIDELGLKTASTCETMGNEALARLTDLTAKLTKKKCKIPKIKCKCCKDPGKGGEFGTFGKNITLCENNLASRGNKQSDYDTIVKHELIHAVQTCYGEDKGKDKCAISVCQEIESYYNSECAQIADPALRKECVKKGVDLSSADDCRKKQENIDKNFASLYDQCTSPTR